MGVGGILNDVLSVEIRFPVIVDTRTELSLTIHLTKDYVHVWFMGRPQFCIPW